VQPWQVETDQFSVFSCNKCSDSHCITFLFFLFYCLKRLPELRIFQMVSASLTTAFLTQRVFIEWHGQIAVSAGRVKVRCELLV
jgi:hypothetical protein